MRKVKVDESSIGLKLAKPVENDSGMVMYGAGLEVSAQMIGKLQSLNVEFLYVEGAGHRRYKKDEYLDLVENAFSKAGKGEAMDRIHQAVLSHIDALYRET